MSEGFRRIDEDIEKVVECLEKVSAMLNVLYCKVLELPPNHAPVLWSELNDLIEELKDE